MQTEKKDLGAETLADDEVKKPDITDQNFCFQIPGSENGGQAETHTIGAAFSIIKSMLNSILNPVLYTNRNGVILGANKSFSRQIAGLPEEKIIGHTLNEVACSNSEKLPGKLFENKQQSILRCFEEWDKTDRQLLKSGESFTLECQGICADGIKRSFLVNKSAFSDEKGEIFGLVTVMQDITEIRQTEKDLRENLEFKKRMLDGIPVPVFYKNTEGRYTGCNKLFTKEIIGLPEEEITGRVYGELTYQAPEDLIKKYDETDVQVYRDGIEHCCELKSRYLPNCLGKEFIVIKAPCFNEDGKISGLVGAVLDVTERNKAQRELQESEEKYRSFIKNFKGIAFQADENFVPVFLHGTVEEITGYSEEELMSEQPWKNIIHPEDLPRMYEEEKRIQSSPGAGYGEIDFRIIHRKGTIKWVHEIYQKIPGNSGKPDMYQGTMYDITERKEAEESLATLELARKKEIHHRIKNNLQVISSLLDLQAERFRNRRAVKTSEVLEAFLESQNRVISMALIHEELHKGGQVDTLNFSKYLQKLTENLFETNRIGNSDISLNMDVEENIFFDMDTAVPLGIIVNELVSNSFKHAFPGRVKGEIKIKLYREKTWERKNCREENRKENYKNTKFMLSVTDNGTGIPQSFNIANPETLGLQLVTTLVDQLNGKLELRKERGTEFRITFAVTEKQ
ncbi:PAS domain S-box protein [Methanosarcina sp. DH2]|nr:PAS domain S-box protein [Methanosarcina sp. DH2]